jgi:PIN domain nuclease of toxin-antitoxin system
MRLLLDTHTFLWWVTNSPQLSPRARAAVADPRNEVLVSAASAWEIATKQRLGKLPGAPQASVRFNELVLLDGFVHLAVDHRHTVRAGAFEVEHRDPFDRMLAAQSELERCALVTLDPAFSLFGTETFW